MTDLFVYCSKKIISVKITPVKIILMGASSIDSIVSYLMSHISNLLCRKRCQSFPNPANSFLFSQQSGNIKNSRTKFATNQHNPKWQH
jgi:hypothetical protein